MDCNIFKIRFYFVPNKIIFNNQILSKQDIDRQKKHSDETKRKISKSLLGRHLSEKTREKIRLVNTGKKLSNETKRKLSITHSGKNHWNYGKHVPESTRRKISESLSLYYLQFVRKNKNFK